MASFDIEGVRHFSHLRAAGKGTFGDLTYTFNRGNGLDAKLRSAGHNRAFYFTETSCWESDIRDTNQGGGSDNLFADKVDLFWIETHGTHDKFGGTTLFYDTPQTDWQTTSSFWQLGENTNAEWLMAYSCDTMDRDRTVGVWNIFAGLHIYCGAWGVMYDDWTTDECGEDVGDNLINGDTVSQAWHDGVSDWAHDNHPLTVCVADAATWNDGHVLWERTYLNRDRGCK